MSTNNFGLQSFTEEHMNKLKQIPINLLRQVVYHRSFDEFDEKKLDAYYLYSGRGPSNSSFHIGHLQSLMFLLEFQKILQSKIYFMISDDEKIMRDNICFEDMNKHVLSTIQQLRKIGFTDENTDIRINTNGLNSKEYKLIVELMNSFSMNTLNHVFGEKNNIGEYFYVFYQMMPCFLDKNKQCIIIAGIDQDPFFRLARDVAEKLGYKKPIVLYIKNVMGLDGSEKMSTSQPETLPIFITDTLEEIKQKIMKVKHVGAGTLDELFLNGANLEQDTLVKLIRIFESKEDNINLLEEAYTIRLLKNSEKHNNLKLLVEDKCIKIRNDDVMITTQGMRIYLINLLYGIIKDFN